MSGQLLQFFLADTDTHLDEKQPDLLWKVVLRTGTWKLRPGPGGMKLHQPLKVYRDKAPEGHISMSSLVKNFGGDAKGPAKENVTIPTVHADGTITDSGFVRKLVIQDVAGEDGSGKKQSLLWAGLEVTDSDVLKKIKEKSLVGVSGGILFDYERTEDAKKFDQVLSHVMVTNSPWINGTGGFHDKPPKGVLASEEPSDLPFGELELDTTPAPYGDPSLPDPAKKDQPASGTVVWKPEEGYQFKRGKVQQALDDWHRSVLANAGMNSYQADFPYYHVEDIADGKAMICCGYGNEKEAWVADFSLSDDGEVVIEPFQNWTTARQEWVAASESQHQPAPQPPPARPAGRGVEVVRRPRPSSLVGLGLREAQAARAERNNLGESLTPTTGGSRMGRISDLLAGVDLSEEQRQAIEREEAEQARRDAELSERVKSEKRAEVALYCGSPDGQTKGRLDELGLGDPGVKKYVRNALLSDDGGPAIELAEHLPDGQKTAGVPKTAADLLKGFIDVLPKKDGRVSLSDQARRIEDDPKPPETPNDDDKKPPREKADAFLSDLAGQGLDLGIAVGSGGGS